MREGGRRKARLERTVDERAQDPDDLGEPLDAVRLGDEVLRPLDVLDREHPRQEVLLADVLALLGRAEPAADRRRVARALPQRRERRAHVPSARARPELLLDRLGLGLPDRRLVRALLAPQEDVGGAARRRHGRDALALRGGRRAAHARDLLAVELEEGRVDLALGDRGLDARAAARGAHEAEAEERLEGLEGDDRLLLGGGALALAGGHLEEELEGLDGAERVGEDRVGLGGEGVVAGVARVRGRWRAEGCGEGRDGAVEDRVVVEADEVQDRRDCRAGRRQRPGRARWELRGREEDERPSDAISASWKRPVARKESAVAIWRECARTHRARTR